MKKVRLVVSALLLVLLLVACGPKAAPAPQSPAPAPAPAAAAPASAPTPSKGAVAPAKPAWETEWEKVIAQAKKESKVVVFISGGFDTRAALTKVAKLQGIAGEVVAGRSQEMLAKVLAERKAGLFLWDAHVGGTGTILTQMKPAGVLEPLAPQFILPDLTDPELIKKVWYGGQLPWVDKDHLQFRIALQPGTALAVNSNMVKDGDIKSYRDLIDPKWKGKFLVHDPTVSGAGQLGFQGVLELMGEAFCRELVAANPIVSRDQRQMIEWLAQGKVALVLAPQPVTVTEFMNVGAAIKIVVPQEGSWLSTGDAGNMVMLKNAPHPNAARLFINLLASKEGQDILAPAVGNNSTRADISTAHLPPERIRKEGVKYVDLNSEQAYIEGRPRSNKLALELFGPLVR